MYAPTDCTHVAIPFHAVHHSKDGVWLEIDVTVQRQNEYVLELNKGVSEYVQTCD